MSFTDDDSRKWSSFSEELEFSRQVRAGQVTKLDDFCQMCWSVWCQTKTQLTRFTWCSRKDTIYSPERLLGLLMPFKLDLVMVAISPVAVYIPEWLTDAATDEHALLSLEINDGARRCSLSRSAQKRRFLIITVNLKAIHSPSIFRWDMFVNLWNSCF